MLELACGIERIHHHAADGILYGFHFGHAQFATWWFAVFVVGMVLHVETLSNLSIAIKTYFPHP
jgi:hypothetical protein